MIARFQNLPIIAKIAVPAAIVALVAVGIVVQASMALSNLSATAASLVDGNAMRVQYSLQAESHFNSAAVSEKNVILSGTDAKAISRTSSPTARPPMPRWMRSIVWRPSPPLPSSAS